jgi:hypothetical protein
MNGRAGSALFAGIDATVRGVRSRLSGLRSPVLHFLLLFVGVLGLCARAYVVTKSRGCNDMGTWQTFAQEVRQHGLGTTYETDAMFNHPPLMGLMAASLDRLAERTGVRFEVWFKVPSLLADVLAATLTYLFVRRRGSLLGAAAFALFCWNPISILVAAYHGNTDSICAALALLAAVCTEDECPFLGGLALGASMNVKLIPLVLIPLLASCQRDWKQFGRFVAGLSIAALPFVPILLWHGKSFYAHALAYRSNSYQWGITGLLYELAPAPRMAQIANAWNGTWKHVGTKVILLSAFALALANFGKRRWSAPELAACGFGFFLVFAPGFGIQYLVYLVPVLFAARVRSAVTYSLTAGAFAFLLYFTAWNGLEPYYSAIAARPPQGVLTLGYVCWVVTIYVLADLLDLRSAWGSWFALQTEPPRVPTIGSNLHEWLFARQASRASLALTDAQRAAVRIEDDAARALWWTARATTGGRRLATVLALYRDACDRFVRAFLFARDAHAEDAHAEIASLSPVAAFDRMEAAIPRQLLPEPRTLDSLRRLQSASNPLDLRGLAVAEEESGGRDRLEAGMRWLSSLVEARSPGEIKTTRVVRVTVVSILGASFAILIALPGNVASGKPATASSTAFNTTAAGAVDGDNNTAAYGFHSQEDPSPWLRIDLERSCRIKEIKIFGRGDGPFDQSIPLALEVSDDGNSFRPIARRTEAFSQVDPWVVDAQGVVARFVRLRGERPSVLVVSEVEVYGRPRH